ncbi:MAG: hypothetical protein PHQ34_00905 [Methanothrix sp.]|nr:hypothetical protein [Methanothrix sp.]
MSKIKLALAILAIGLLCFMSNASAFPNYDGHYAHHPGSWGPVTYHWYTPSYYYYNYFDPWWNANVYGPFTYHYWYNWGW